MADFLPVDTGGSAIGKINEEDDENLESLESSEFSSSRQDSDEESIPLRKSVPKKEGLSFEILRIERRSIDSYTFYSSRSFSII